MDNRSIISVANYLGYLEGKGVIEIEEEDQMYGMVEQVEADVDAAYKELNKPFDFWTEVERSIKRQKSRRADSEL